MWSTCTFAKKKHLPPVIEVNCSEMSVSGEDTAGRRCVLKVPQVGVRARLQIQKYGIWWIWISKLLILLICVSNEGNLSVAAKEVWTAV